MVASAVETNDLMDPPSTAATDAVADDENPPSSKETTSSSSSNNKPQPQQDATIMMAGEEEETSTTLSWTSSNVSLSPLNPPFLVAPSSDETAATTTSSASKQAAAVETQAPTKAEEEQQQARSAKEAQETSSRRQISFPKHSVGEEAAPAFAAVPPTELREIATTTATMNSNNDDNDNNNSSPMGADPRLLSFLPNSDNSDAVIQEDDEGDPIVDASVLHRLQMMTRQPSNGYGDDDDDDDDAVMFLESNSEGEDDDDSDKGDEFGASSDSKKSSTGGEPRQSFFLPQFRPSPPHKKAPESITATASANISEGDDDKHQQQHPLLSKSGGGTGVFGLFSPGAGEESGHPDDDDDDDDDFLQTNSLLNQFQHHGRQPSTIVEEFSESARRDGDEIFLREQQTQRPQPAQPQQQQQPAAPIRSISSLDSLLRPLLQQQPQPRTPSEERGGSPSLSNSNNNNSNGNSPPSTPLRYKHASSSKNGSRDDDPLAFAPLYRATLGLRVVSRRLLPRQHLPHAGAATWIGFWALLAVTCANYVLTPMRDAIALQVGVQHMPRLTLASTVLAVFSSVPIGWLFEAPDPGRRKLWKRMGLTRGETQGSSLALFYRFFALTLLAYAVGFQGIEFVRGRYSSGASSSSFASSKPEVVQDLQLWWFNLTKIWMSVGQAMYIAFFLVVHLMKLHCLSLVWGVTTEALEYEEVARKQQQKSQNNPILIESNKMRLQRLSLIGFGGTLGGILGSFLASSMAQVLRLPGLLLLAASLLEISAELSIELGRIMRKHWEGQQQLFQSTNDLASLDPSMKRSASMGSMKRISSGNSLNRVKSTSDLSGGKPLSSNSLSSTGSSSHGATTTSSSNSATPVVDEDSFSQRLIRGLSTILKSRLLMAIFTYNALYASTTVLLSFQRAALVASRSSTTSVQADTAFLANINMVSSAAIFALQSSGAGAYVAHRCGSRGTLALMPLIRLLGVVALAWWHRFSGGRPPNLLVFLVVDECCKIMNLAVAKPVRESLWRGLSNEARYEAKPIVDTLANRWGGGSAAFLVSFVDKTLDLFGVVGSEHDGVRNMFGFPPVLFLCVLISAWWAAVSADLGKIRKNIDLELKKRQ